MANTLSVIDMVAREAQRIAHEKLTFLGTIDRSYDPSFANKAFQIGDTLRVRKPNQYTRRKGSRVMDVQDQAEETQNVVVATQDGVDMKFNSAELTLSIDELSRRYIEPAVSVLVSGIEGDALSSLTKVVAQNTGSTGEVVGATDLDAVSQARAKLNQQLAPKDGNRSVQLDSVTMAAVVNGATSGTLALFNPTTDISKAFREGFIGRNSMATWYENDRTYAHTNTVDADVAYAVDDTTRLAAYTDADGLSVLNFDEKGTLSYSLGTTFTIADLYDCHPETKAKYAHLKQFTVIVPDTSTTATESDITFSPTIRTGGAKQNCWISGGSASIADLEDNVTACYAGNGTVYQSNLMYHKEAFTFVTADLPIMDDSIRCVRRVKDGLSIRCWQGSDIRNDELLLRLDILYGFKAIRPEWACRINN